MSFFNIPPTDFLPDKPSWWRKWCWFIRNPDFHLIPSMNRIDKPTWNPNGGLWIIDNRFVSYRGKHIECYIGWRPSGSFGIALRHANAKSY